MRGARVLLVVSISFWVAQASAQEAVPRCGAEILKANGKIIDTLIQEAVDACVAGSSGNPAPLDTDAVQSAVDKFNQALLAANERHGASNCFLTSEDQLTLEDAIDLAQPAADDYCKVPQP